MAKTVSTLFILVCFIVFIMAALVLVNNVRAEEIEITGCTNITHVDNASNRFILNMPTAGGPAVCINITQPDVELVCANRSSYIKGDDGTFDSAIYLNNVRNVSIKDCNITNFGYAIYGNNVTDINITNITFYSTSNCDISLFDIANTTIKNNIFNASEGCAIFTDLINAVTNNNTLIEENTFVDILTSYIIKITNDLNSLINNNLILSSYGEAIEADVGGNGMNITISNNTFKARAINPTICGIKVIGSSGQSISVLNNNLTAGDMGYGICVDGNNHLIKDNIIRNYSRNLWIDDSDGNYIENLNSSFGTYGVFIGSDSFSNYNNLIINSDIKNNSYGVYFYDKIAATNLNNTIKDSNVSLSTTKDITTHAGTDGNLNNTLLNVSFNTFHYTNETGGDFNNALYVKWYLNVQVVYDNGTYVNGATVNVSDILGNNLTLTTNATGWITQQNMTEFMVNNCTQTYYNNYTIHAYKNPENSSQVNFTQGHNTFVNITLATSTDEGETPGEIPGGGGGGTTQPLPYCGDGTCNIDENCVSCPEDCGNCCFELCESYAVIPGNFCCEGLTASGNYDMDCFLETGSCIDCILLGAMTCTDCGNGICESCENYCNCPDDCDLCQNLKLDVEVDLGFERQGGFLGMIWRAFMDFILSLFSA